MFKKPKHKRMRYKLNSLSVHREDYIRILKHLGIDPLSDWHNVKVAFELFEKQQEDVHLLRSMNLYDVKPGLAEALVIYEDLTSQRVIIPMHFDFTEKKS